MKLNKIQKEIRKEVIKLIKFGSKIEEHYVIIKPNNKQTDYHSDMIFDSLNLKFKNLKQSENRHIPELNDAICKIISIIHKFKD